MSVRASLAIHCAWYHHCIHSSIIETAFHTKKHTSADHLLSSDRSQSGRLCKVDFRSSFATSLVPSAPTKGEDAKIGWQLPLGRIRASYGLLMRGIARVKSEDAATFFVCRQKWPRPARTGVQPFVPNFKHLAKVHSGSVVLESEKRKLACSFLRLSNCAYGVHRPVTSHIWY